MPIEIFSKTGNDVANSVKRQFGDPDGRQIVDADILEWINQAQQEIITLNGILKQTAQRNIVSGQDTYEYDSERVQYIEAIHYDGVPLEPYTFQEAEAYILRYKWDSEMITQGTDVKPLIWYERAGVVYLYPKPAENITNGLRMFFSEQPTELTALSSVLSTPDRYYPRILELVLARAYQLDENWEAAKYKQSEYFNGMETMANQENVAKTSTYSSVTVRVEDL
jgi:hypothetical protein